MTGVNQTTVSGHEGRQIDEIGNSGWGTLFSVWIEDTELQRLLAAYDPTVGTSPGVADARPVLRAILNAALSADSGGQ